MLPRDKLRTRDWVVRRIHMQDSGDTGTDDYHGAKLRLNWRTL